MELIKFTDETRDMYNNRFGMFVHWGLYSQTEGRWKEHEKLLRPKEGDGSWIMFLDEIPVKEYMEIAYDFKPDLDWAENLVTSAKNAGVKYIVFTAKHHDGFSWFKTDASPYNSYDMCYGRDFVRELKDACDRHGIKLGLYYSHCLDWAEPGGGGAHYVSKQDVLGDVLKHNNYWDFGEQVPDEAYAGFFENKVIPQVKELLTNYGDIYIIWFDYPHDIKRHQSEELYNLVKELQPNCMVNSRIAHAFGDYSSLGDNMIPTTPTNMPAESLVTLNDTWGYLWYDDNWKTPEYSTELIVNCVASETSLLMNVGPMPDGKIPPATEDILSFIGDWMKKYSDSIYNMNPNPFKTKVDWGNLACKENKIYVYISDTTKSEYTLGGLEVKVTKVTDPDGNALAFTQTDDEITFSFEDKYGFLPVIVLECDKEITPVKEIVQCGDSLNLFPIWGQKHCVDGLYENTRLEYCIFDPENGKHGLALNRACIIRSWESPEEWLTWNAGIKRAGEYEIKMTTGLCEYDGGTVTEIYKDGKLVANANCEKATVAYRYELSKSRDENVRLVYNLGKVKLDEAGEYTIVFKRTASAEALPLSHICLERA